MKNKINVTVDLSIESPYAEGDSEFYVFKRKLMYSNILKLANNFLGKKKKGKVLEIGTGSGFLISFLEKKYPNIDFKGLEFDHRLVDLANSKLSRAIVYQGNAEDFGNFGNFDLVISSQVIEHLYNPVNFLNSVKKVLKEDGILIFTTPNLDCMAKRILGNKWHGYRLDHVSLKTRNQWDSLLFENGFEKIYSGSTFFSGIPILNKLPFGIFNWMLLYFIGSLRWDFGESYIGIFKIKNCN